MLCGAVKSTDVLVIGEYVSLIGNEWGPEKILVSWETELKDNYTSCNIKIGHVC